MSVSNEDIEVQDTLSEALLPSRNGMDEDVVSDTVEPSPLPQLKAEGGGGGGDGDLGNSSRDNEGNRVMLDPLLVNEEEAGMDPILDTLKRTVQWFLPEASGDSNGTDYNARETATTLSEGVEDEGVFQGMLQQGYTLMDCSPFVSTDPSFVKSAITLVLIVAVLQASYLMWGYAQELVMTNDYNPTDRVPDGKFPSATFAVWTNRFVAMIVSSVVVFWRQGLSGSFQKSPLRAFSPCAFSNTLSSYCQYSSLRYIPFPFMMICKSLKIVVVMIVGKLLNGTRYPQGQYLEALVISLGVAISSFGGRQFSFETMSSRPIIGFLLILGFLFSDAFTVQWQGKIYDTYGRRNVDPFQMMLGVNIFAIALTSISLVLSDEIGVVVEFLAMNPLAIKHLATAAICSCVGQLCVFFAIREYGPVVFTIIMTTRQVIAMVFSSIIFGHSMSALGILGAVLVFATVAYQIRRNYSLSRDPEVLQE